jgi:hypothetical protein
MLYHHGRAAVGGSVMVLSGSRQVVATVVEVESTVKANAEPLGRIENDRANKGRSVISVGLENCRGKG